MNKTGWLMVPSFSAILLLSGCSPEPEWVGIYEDCKEKVSESVAEIKQSEDTKSMSGMMESMGNSACEMIKNTCEKNPEGSMCQAIIDGYGKEE